MGRCDGDAKSETYTTIQGVFLPSSIITVVPAVVETVGGFEFMMGLDSLMHKQTPAGVCGRHVLAISSVVPTKR